jgi:hypothetical protein
VPRRPFDQGRRHLSCDQDSEEIVSLINRRSYLPARPARTLLTFDPDREQMDFFALSGACIHGAKMHQSQVAFSKPIT